MLRLRTKFTGPRPAWLGHTAFGFCAAHDKPEPACEGAYVTTDGSPTPHQGSVASQNASVPVQRRATQPRPCAPTDTTRPATANYPPVRKECLSRGFPSKEPPQQFHHITICTSHHHTTAYHIARTNRPDGRRVTRHLENFQLFRLFRFRELAGKGCSASEPHRCTRLGGEKR